MNRYFLMLLFAFLALFAQAQELSSYNVVLRNDKISIYGKEFPSGKFGDSYFLCMQQYEGTFTEDAFKTLEANLKKQDVTIIAFAAADKRSVVCVFPKPSLKGISNIQGFISVNFDQNLIEKIKSRQRIHVQVVDKYDPLDKEEEKGFKGFKLN